MSTTERQVPGDPLETLIARCLRAHDEGDRAVLESLCRQHPEQAAALRARMTALADAGLAGVH